MNAYAASFARPMVPWLFIGASAAFCVLSFSFFLFSLPPQNVAAAGVSTIATTTSYVRPLEVHIANDGLILLRSAHVVAVNTDTIMVSTAWGSTDLNWVVRLDATRYGAHNFGTRFIDRHGGEISRADIHAE